jgi:hypothetical protein
MKDLDKMGDPLPIVDSSIDSITLHFVALSEGRPWERVEKNCRCGECSPVGYHSPSH